MTRFRVRWAEVAARDLQDIVSFIAAESPSGAAAVLDRIEKRALALETSPRRGRIGPELRDFGVHSLRELIIKPYRLIYGIVRTEVHVLAVFDARRDLHDVLMDRFIRDRTS